MTAVSGTTNWNKLNLTWTDNSTAEVGFKVERGTAAAGPFTQIATTAAGVSTYQDSGLAATTTYYYRVRSYNANGNSDYSNTASRTTGNAPPVLNAIGNKTVANSTLLTFTASASDPNAPAPATTTWQNFTSFPHNTPNETVLFNKPLNSATTSAFIDTAATNYTRVVTSGPSAWGSGNKSMVAGWTFKTGQTDYWVRLNTFNTPTNPNPAIALDQRLQFKFQANKNVKVGIGIRETGTTAAYGANGGTTGSLEWVAVTNVLSGSKPVPNRLCNANTSYTLNFNIPFEPQAAFTGDGIVDQSGAKGVLEHVIIRGEGGTGAYTVWMDDFQVVVANNLVYSLDAGAPSGATIGRRTGKFTWTPTTGQVGVHNITVRVTDNLGGQDWETIKVTVTGTGNAAPVLAAIGSKTVNELSPLTFTATATDANAGQTLTFSLDAGAPSGASINSSSGAFSWTPTEVQGPGSYPITVRVTDNGSPSSNDWELITVTVNEVNSAPALSSIADQTANETQMFTFTPSASDSDVPANTLTYSLVSGPEGMTINATSGQISWTPSEVDGAETNQVTIRVKDNGVPSLVAERTFNVIVNEMNTAPVLHLGTTVLTDFPITDLETFPDGTYNGTVLLRQPHFSGSTTNFLDATPNWTSVTDTFPEGVGGQRVLAASFSFKTGTTNPWLRLTTFNTTAGYLVPNPTIDLTRKVRFSIYSDRSIKVALGVRETGTTAAIGADGGTTGTLEWVGATVTSGSPNPSRVVNAGEWTTLEFDLPSEVISAFPGSGNGVLSSATGKGVLEHLAIVPNDGTGVYNLYVDQFIITIPTGNFVIDTGKTIVLTNGATDVDIPVQALSFSLEPNAPTNAIIDSKTGTLEWTPNAWQSPSTNVFGIRVTDDGVPALSDVKNVTIVVNKVNTAPRMVYFFREFFITPGEFFEYEASAVDDDLPADTLGYSFVGGWPTGSTLDPATGRFTWTPATANGTNYVTIRVSDNGTPPLHDDLLLVIVVSPPNNEPTISLGTARATEPVVNYESFTNGTPNEQVMFKKPSNSATTSAFIDTVVTNYTTVTTSFPAGNANAGAKVLRAEWTFKTGISEYWVRLTTANTTFLPNPTINASEPLQFNIHTSKTLKVGLGIRETNTTAENGANGGTTGDVEYVGCTSKIGSTPVPSRIVNANTWTMLEFDLPNEPCQTLTGNSILAAGQQVLEHLILKGEGGTGVYTVYIDNFEVVTTTALPGTLTMKSNSKLTFTATGSDPDSHPITIGLEEGAPVEATINSSTGDFAWTPSPTYDGTTNEITVYVEDAPPGGQQTKRAYETVTVIVVPDTLAVQSQTELASVSSGETVTVEWNAVVGELYQVQYKEGVDDSWTNAGEPIVASEPVEPVDLATGGGTRFYRIIVVSGNSTDE